MKMKIYYRSDVSHMQSGKYAGTSRYQKLLFRDINSYNSRTDSSHLFHCNFRNCQCPGLLPLKKNKKKKTPHPPTHTHTHTHTLPPPPPPPHTHTHFIELKIS